MGCDIHSRVQKFIDGKWKTVEVPLFPSDMLDLFTPKSRWNEPSVEPFSWRSYGMFAFLADVRNYSYVPPISSPRGLPDDVTNEEDEYGDHSFSWLSLKELLDFDYSQTFENRRTFRDGSGAADAGPGNGVVMTFREFLGLLFFRDLAIMTCLGKPEEIRVVFGFDN